MANRTCSVPDCDALIGPKSARGMCSIHYRRWLARGTTNLLPVPTVAERLMAGLERKSNGCLEWTGYTNERGYGLININGKPVRTHRLAWALVNGPIPDGVMIRHFICDNPPCCDTEHLRPGTQAENLADMDAKGRRVNGQAAKTHCLQGHAYDEANTFMRPTGGRVCRECNRSACARYRSKQRSGVTLVSNESDISLCAEK